MRRVGMTVAAMFVLVGLSGCGVVGEPTAMLFGDSSDVEGAGDHSGADFGDSAADGNSEGESGSAGAYCSKTSSAGQGILSPDTQRTDLVQVYRDIAAVAPADIQPEWTKVADSLEKLQLLQKEVSQVSLDTSNPAVSMERMEEMQRDIPALSTEFQSALDAISTDITKRCAGL